VSSIGFHLYCKLLKRTILAMQGKIPSIVTDAKVEFLADARIPENYIPEAHLRMEIYQRFGEALSQEEVDEIWSEVKDRFGAPPEPAIWLYHLTRVRAFAARHGFSLIKQEKFTLTVERQKGKESTIKKVMVQLPKKPQELEKKVIALLVTEFGIKIV
jgi:transcription-repair coupling factor (superfamily II helicase)